MLKRRLASLAVITMASLAGSLPGATPATAQQLAAPVTAPVSASAPNDLDRLLARAETEERALVAELEATGPALDMTRKRIVARGRAYYRLMRAGLLPAGAGFEALVDHAAHVEKMRRALERDVTAEATLVHRRSEIEARLERIRAERAPLELQREAMNRARAALQEVEERRAAFARAFQTSVRPGAVAIYGADNGPIDSDAREGFRGLKGRLPFPIAGRAEVRRIGKGQGGPAVELAAPPGSSVRSVAAGRVAFADRYDAYGLTVLIDHGDHYYSLYGGLGRAEVQVGDSIAGGARIGTTATGPLSFEIRKNAEMLDPGPWLGL